MDLTFEASSTPGLGDIVDGTIAVSDLVQGDYEDAAWGAAGVAVPFVGTRVIKKVGGLFGRIFRGADDVAPSSPHIDPTDVREPHSSAD